MKALICRLFSHQPVPRLEGDHVENEAGERLITNARYAWYCLRCGEDV